MGRDLDFNQEPTLRSYGRGRHFGRARGGDYPGLQRALRADSGLVQVIALAHAGLRWGPRSACSCCPAGATARLAFCSTLSLTYNSSSWKFPPRPLARLALEPVRGAPCLFPVLSCRRIHEIAARDIKTAFSFGCDGATRLRLLLAAPCVQHRSCVSEGEYASTAASDWRQRSPGYCSHCWVFVGRRRFMANDVRERDSQGPTEYSRAAFSANNRGQCQVLRTALPSPSRERSRIFKGPRPVEATILFAHPRRKRWLPNRAEAKRTFTPLMMTTCCSQVSVEDCIADCYNKCFHQSSKNSRTPCASTQVSVVYDETDYFFLAREFR